MRPAELWEGETVVAGTGGRLHRVRDGGAGSDGDAGSDGYRQTTSPRARAGMGTRFRAGAAGGDVKTSSVQGGRCCGKDGLRSARSWVDDSMPTVLDAVE